MKREKDGASLLDIATLSEDPDLIRQIQHNREDREQGRVYGREGGLEYLQARVKEFEHGQNLNTGRYGYTGLSISARIYTGSEAENHDWICNKLHHRGGVFLSLATWFGVTEEQLYSEQEIATPIGEKLYGDEYQYVLENPIMKWNAPTSILYGKKDELCEEEVLVSFCRSFSCELAISEHSEHYFHTANAALSHT